MLGRGSERGESLVGAGILEITSNYSNGHKSSPLHGFVSQSLWPGRGQFSQESQVTVSISFWEEAWAHHPHQQPG